MRRLAAIVVVACVLTLIFALPASAQVSIATLNTNSSLQVGASHTLPNGAYGFSDGCETGYSGATEFRCSFEFDLSQVISSSKITAATLTIRRTSGCPTNDCPIDLSSFTGNGSADLSDVTAGSDIATTTPSTNNQRSFNVLGLIQAHRDASERWAGFHMQRSGDSARNPDVQDWSLSDSDLKLTISYIPFPVDVIVQKDGTGTGTVVSNAPGINCGSTCTGTFTNGEPITFTATPTGSSIFVSWNGQDCAEGDANLSCTIHIGSVPGPIVATFNKATPTSAPPSATPRASASHGSPKPTSTSGATHAPATQAAASQAAASAEPSAGASEPAPTEIAQATFAPGETVGPTIAPVPQPTSDGGGLPIGPIILIVGIVLALAAGAGAYLYARSRQGTAPPGV
jgi:hypothetical protein